MLLAGYKGMLGIPKRPVKPAFIRAVSAAKPKVADYPFTTLVPSTGVVRMDCNEKSFVVAADIRVDRARRKARARGFAS